jgi:alkanesulfonate monooxygenase SsuD/methylene tetrahydromethanopterin reductase-like flavin-dependent oxidoreductase (luciferase family)
MADPPVSRVIEMTKLAEENGFDYAWLWDSHVLWQEIYPIFTLQAVNTSRIRLGPCVTNPATRDVTVTASVLATLNDISGGRMDCGIGRGDSARRVIGQAPVTTERGSSSSGPKGSGSSPSGWPGTAPRPFAWPGGWATG